MLKVKEISFKMLKIWLFATIVLDLAPTQGESYPNQPISQYGMGTANSNPPYVAPPVIPPIFAADPKLPATGNYLRPNLRPEVPVPGNYLKPNSRPSQTPGSTNLRDMSPQELLQLTRPAPPAGALGSNVPPVRASEVSSTATNFPTSLMPRPGACPLRQCNSLSSSQPRQWCRSDFECSLNEKCCQDPCWTNIFSCAPAAVAPPEVQPSAPTCPAQTPCPDPRFKLVCESDKECSRGFKCCPDRCLSMNVCKQAVINPPEVVQPPGLVQPPGVVLPPFNPYAPFQPPYGPGPIIPPPPVTNKCNYYCPGTLDCCDNISRSGSCPAMALCYSAQQSQAMLSQFTPCSVDDHCQASHKCCLDFCLQRQICLPAVASPTDHPGTCPAEDCRAPQSNKTPCTSDRQCQLFQRCCASSCTPGRSFCMDSYDGFIDQNPAPPAPTCNKYCPGSNYCCDGESKSGYCPWTKLCQPPFTVSPVCTSDYNCGDDEKCCPNSCTRNSECSAIVHSPDDHVGTCPTLRCTGLAPPIGKLNQCEKDSDCLLHHKCCKDCSNNYGCVDPSGNSSSTCRILCPDKRTCCDSMQKNGFCPSKSRCSAASTAPFRLCNEDNECSGSMKCCHDNCLDRNICQAPASEADAHPGSCPATPCDPSTARKYICHTDADCFLEERCCMNLNGFKECQLTTCTRISQSRYMGAASSPPQSSVIYTQSSSSHLRNPYVYPGSPGQALANPGQTLVNPGPVLVNPGPDLANPGPVLANPGPTLVNPGPVLANPGPALANSGPPVLNPQLPPGAYKSLPAPNLAQRPKPYPPSSQGYKPSTSQNVSPEASTSPDRYVPSPYLPQLYNYRPAMTGRTHP